MPQTHEESHQQVSGTAAPGDSPLPPACLPPRLPSPAPCCRTRRSQARWCSCPRTSPPLSCQPVAGPTSVGRSWPPWGIGAPAPAAKKRPELLLYAHNSSDSDSDSDSGSFMHNGTAAGCGASSAGLPVLSSACKTWLALRLRPQLRPCGS